MLTSHSRARAALCFHGISFVSWRLSTVTLPPADLRGNLKEDDIAFEGLVPCEGLVGNTLRGLASAATDGDRVVRIGD